MTQDTRKDRRAKIVSLNVRYKSATVDEFIENHSHDVSKGGLFIKTASPFPPGTLLKFEIRIAGDKAVIAGVGRVVWKRETSQAGPDAPAGMGVKFIKIDDSSRVVIDKLVLSRGDGKNAYDEGGGDAGSATAPSEPPAALPRPAVAARPGGPDALARPSTPAAKDAPRPGGTASAAPSSAASSQPAPFRPTPSAAKFSVPAKATMMGLGAQGAGKGAAAPGPAAGRPPGDSLRSKETPRVPSVSSQGASLPSSSAPSTSPMFPKTNSEKEMPPKNEQTVMKQAAELLEEALRGAGGSMDEIGQNPLFDVAKDAAISTGSTAASPTVPKATPSSEELDWGSSEHQPSPAPAAIAASAAPPAEDEIDRLMRSSAPPADLSAAKSKAPAEPAFAASPRRQAVAKLADEEPQKNKWLVPVLAVAGAGVLGFLFYTQVYATGADKADTPPPPAASVTQPATSASAPSATQAAPSESAAAPEAPSASASASASASGDAAAAVPETAAVAPKTAVPVAPWRPPPRSKPKPAPTATDENAAPAPTEANAPATASPTPAPATADTATAPSASTPPPAPKPTAKPTTKPAGGKPQPDDNPY
jgi:uncharacterized protein (TIGR02266 family)